MLSSGTNRKLKGKYEFLTKNCEKIVYNFRPPFVEEDCSFLVFSDLNTLGLARVFRTSVFLLVFEFYLLRTCPKDKKVRPKSSHPFKFPFYLLVTFDVVFPKINLK